MDIIPKVFTMKDLVAQVEAGKRMFIHAPQFAAFLVETEYLRIPYCIKTSVVGDQVILERWDTREAVGLERRDVRKPWLH